MAGTRHKWGGDYECARCGLRRKEKTFNLRRLIVQKLWSTDNGRTWFMTESNGPPPCPGKKPDEKETPAPC